MNGTSRSHILIRLARSQALKISQYLSEMSLPRDKAWFAAKTYGYGWGFPLRWQGWLVMIAYIVFMIVGATYLAEQSLRVFIIGCIFLTSILLVVCYWKGEHARWRWGHKTPPERPLSKLIAGSATQGFI